MRGEEFGDIYTLWSGAVEPAEQREMEQIARLTPVRARLVQLGELALAAAIAAAIVAAMLWRADTTTSVIGAIMLALLGWSGWNRHRLAAASALAPQGDGQALLADMAKAKEAELRRSAIGLALFLPGILLAGLLNHAVRVGPDGTSFASFLSSAMLKPSSFVVLAIIASLLVLLTLSHVRKAGELARLRELAAEYADEARRDRESQGGG